MSTWLLVGGLAALLVAVVLFFMFRGEEETSSGESPNEGAAVPMPALAGESAERGRERVEALGFAAGFVFTVPEDGTNLALIPNALAMSTLAAGESTCHQDVAAGSLVAMSDDFDLLLLAFTDDGTDTCLFDPAVDNTAGAPKTVDECKATGVFSETALFLQQGWITNFGEDIVLCEWWN